MRLGLVPPAFLALLAALAASSCASAGDGVPTSVAALGLVGVYRFELQRPTYETGRLVLTDQDRFRVVCDNDYSLPDPPAPVAFGPGSVRITLCGGTAAEIRPLDDGRVQATLTWYEEVPYTAQGPCVRWEQVDNRRRCVQYENEIRYRRQEQRDVVELEVLGRNLGAIPSDGPRLMLRAPSPILI